MKKYLILGLLVFAPFLAKADVPDGTYFFQNGQGYDANGVQTFFCLGTTSQMCYTVEGDFAFMRDLSTKIDQLQSSVNQLQNTVSQLQTSSPPVVVAPTPAPVVADGAVSCSSQYVNFYGNEVICSNTNSQLSAYFTTLTESNDYGHITSPTQDYQLTDVLPAHTSGIQIRPNTHDNIGAGVSISYILKDENGETVGQETNINLGN